MALAVVVQQLVPAEIAGILFTANPINGKLDEVVINAVWGLGEAIVGGLVTPDTLTLEKASGRVLSRETADKHVITVRVESGTVEQPVPEARRRAPVLDEGQAAELARLGVQIERLYGMPMEIKIVCGLTLSIHYFNIVSGLMLCSPDGINPMSQR